MNLCDGLMMMLMRMMLVLDLKIDGIATVVTSMTIAFVVTLAAFAIASNHLSTIYASVHPKIDH